MTLEWIAIPEVIGSVRIDGGAVVSVVGHDSLDEGTYGGRPRSASATLGVSKG